MKNIFEIQVVEELSHSDFTPYDFADQGDFISKGDYLAVGATKHRNSSNTGYIGRVFIFKNVSGEWKSDYITPGTYMNILNTRYKCSNDKCDTYI